MPCSTNVLQYKCPVVPDSSWEKQLDNEHDLASQGFLIIICIMMWQKCCN